MCILLQNDGAVLRDFYRDHFVVRLGRGLEEARAARRHRRLLRARRAALLRRGGGGALVQAPSDVRMRVSAGDAATAGNSPAARG